jgi:translation initiation factor IF-2
VAADDCVNEQTIEAISHAKDSGSPLVVAINKIDKSTADHQRIRHELLNQNVVLEEFGGDVMAVNISAKTGENIDKLEEVILLQAELMDLKANPGGPANGTVIEASVEKGRGIVTMVLVQRGTLKLGDIFVAGTEFGRVKTLHDSYKQKITEAGPSMPVEILGFSGIPMAGDSFSVVDSESKAKEVAEKRKQLREEQKDVLHRPYSAESLMGKIAEGDTKELAIVLKTDTRGSLEAIISSIAQIPVGDVRATVIHGSIGNITESDVMLAKTSNACVLGFHVKATPQAKVLAEDEGIIVSYHNIIYEMFENIENLKKKLLAPKWEEKILGRAELRVVFSKGKFVKIAGCYVSSGVIRRSNSKVRVIRDGDIVFIGKIESMRHEQEDIKEAKEGHECGIILEGFNGISQKDIIECFEVVEVSPLR